MEAGKPMVPGQCLEMGWDPQDAGKIPDKCLG